ITTNYFVTGTNLNGCSNSAQAVVTVNPNPVISATGATICNGNPATISANGGVNYLWSNGQTAQSIIVNPIITTNYFVTGTNINGCTNSALAVVTVNPNPLISATGAAVCNGKSATISANGGFYYIWNNGKTAQSIIVNPISTTTYFVTGTNLNGCSNSALAVVTVNPNPVISATSATICDGGSATISANGGLYYLWSNGQAGQSIIVNPVSTTTYRVTGTDINGCTNTARAIVTINNNPSTSNVSVGFCEGSNVKITISVSNGSGTYTFKWVPTVGIDYPDSQSVFASPTVSTNYIISITDKNGCKTMSHVSINVNPLPKISIANQFVCYGNSAALSPVITNGTPPYTFNWSPANGLNSTTEQNVISRSTTTTTYTIAIHDSKGCGSSKRVAVKVNPELTSWISNTVNATCGNPNGSVTVAASGGTPYTSGGIHYNYKWNILNQGTPTINNLSAGTYTVVITDSLGCSDTAQVVLTNTPALLINTNTTPADCGNPSGSATVIALGGTPPYTYLWSTFPQKTTTVITNLLPSMYEVTVTDSKGCQAVKTVIVNDSNKLRLTMHSTPENCNGKNGTATAIPTGECFYTYLWSNGETKNIISNLTHNTYTVTVQSGTCIIKGSVIVNNISGPEADFTFSPSVLDWETTLIADFTDLSRPGGNPIIKWYWDFGDKSNSPVQNPTHKYSEKVSTYTIYLVVTDKKGCIDTARKNIIVKDNFTVYIPNAFSPNDDGLNDVFGPQGTKIDTKEGYLMIIYDRWGETIYKTNDFFKPWNARFEYDSELVQIGTYVYKIQVKELDGPVYEFIGRVSVIR
ncbi:MAG: gliding motility-associated C-terminal domain-containing protein, partial [Bacteroidales bacterium]|nr:gliding motility-associated C-terminal domain-containing protein [Bacteroidales bacterium]